MDMTPPPSLPRVYNIPAGTGFAAALVAGIYEQAHQHYGNDPAALSHFRILLPTRRGCRVIRDMFLQHSEGRPLILPRLQALGDVDEDELSLHLPTPETLDKFLQLRPAMPATRRRLLLTRLVQQKVPDMGWGPSLGLADTLARLLDQVETEGLNLANLPGLVDQDHLALHWQETVNFLDILSQSWPAILEERGYMGAAARRDALLHLQAEIWQTHPPAGHIIAAGSTGSLPATRHLLATIAGLPQGCIVLPGLDQDMAETDWNEVDDSHPQATLHFLLQEIGIGRHDVQPWHDAANNSDDRSKKSRRQLAAQMMRPAAQTHRWADLQWEDLGLHDQTEIEDLQQKLWTITCASPEEEARLIALALRQTLEIPGRIAALVTPDRNLARRVAMACRRWGIEVDDSAGIPLGDTPVGSFILLLIEACSRHLAPSALLPLLQHEFIGLDLTKPQRDTALQYVDHYLLRGPRPGPGIDGLRIRLEAACQGYEGHKIEPALSYITDIINKIDNILSPVLQQDRKPGSALLRALLEAAEALAATPQASGAERLWRGTIGEAAALFFADLASHAEDMPVLQLSDLFDMLSRMMAGVTVRTPVGVHPRLRILGQLEARLIQANLMIAAGLNEGVWPPDPGQDPWLSRPMRRRFGLPPPERSTALAGHDFVQCFCADRVILTRTARADGKPTLPSRWLQRLETVFKAADLPEDLTFPEGAQKLLALAREGDLAGEPQPASRPAPCPPADRRLQALSVTQVETLLSNPYGIYAGEILRLKPFEPVEKPIGSAERGTFVHNVLHEFIKVYSQQLPDNASKIIIDIALAKRTAMAGDSADWDYWWPRFERLAESFIAEEINWRTDSAARFPEIKGQLTINTGHIPLILRGRADRIDRMHDGTYAIIDYKSGGEYKAKELATGARPQLPLEAMILQAGGFDGLGTAPVSYIGYWKLTGGKEPINTSAHLTTDTDLQDVIAMTKAGFEELVTVYARPDTPFTCRPDPERLPRFDDYKHLSRLDEWADGDEDSEEVAA